MTLHDLGKRADLNGQRGVLLSRDERRLRYRVRITASGEEVNVMPHNFTRVSSGGATSDTDEEELRAARAEPAEGGSSLPRAGLVSTNPR